MQAGNIRLICIICSTSSFLYHSYAEKKTKYHHISCKVQVIRVLVVLVILVILNLVVQVIHFLVVLVEQVGIVLVVLVILFVLIFYESRMYMMRSGFE